MANTPTKPSNIAVHPKAAEQAGDRPSRADAEEAVRTLLSWAGDDPHREGLHDTPKRVARAYEEFFAGYGQDPVDYLTRTFEEVDGYDEMVFRAMVNDNSYFYDIVGLESEGTTIDFQIGVNSYLYGTRFVCYLANNIHQISKLF